MGRVNNRDIYESRRWLNDDVQNVSGYETMGISGGDGDETLIGLIDGSITSLVVPEGLKIVRAYAFRTLPRLVDVVFPSTLEVIRNYSFEGCTSLNIDELPSSLTSLQSYAFYNCYSIKNMYCGGAVTDLETRVFCGSSMSLETLRFPNASGTVYDFCGNSNFGLACQKLKMADVGHVSHLNLNAFANCYELKTLVLRNEESVCRIQTNTFSNTPMSGYQNQTGTVYVPNELIGSYKTATNWSTLYNNGTVVFEPIEGSEYEL